MSLHLSSLSTSSVLFLLSSLFVILSMALTAQSLNVMERNELSRKFKYYFRSVRPIAAENILSNQNGSYFTIATAIHVLESASTPPSSLSASLYLMLTYVDDRLVLRDLADRFEIPGDEFLPWLPRLSTTPPLPVSSPLTPSIFLSPSTGRLTLYYKLKTLLGCTSRSWKHPFETFTCSIKLEISGDEILHVVEHRDLRQESEIDSVAFEIVDVPIPAIVFTYSSSWLSALISVYLPSFLIFAVVLFAQWKRRKTQIIVTVTALISIMILLSSNRDENRSVSLLDLWLCSTFLHTVTLLVVDLTLPARRIRYRLLLDVDGKNEYRPVPNGKTDSSPLLGGARAFMAIQKYATKKFGASAVETKLVNAPSKMPIQQQVTTSTIGYRKRMALSFTFISYCMFCLFYFLIITSIE